MQALPSEQADFSRFEDLGVDILNSSGSWSVTLGRDHELTQIASHRVSELELEFELRANRSLRKHGPELWTCVFVGRVFLAIFFIGGLSGQAPPRILSGLV